MYVVYLTNRRNSAVRMVMPIEEGGREFAVRSKNTQREAPAGDGDHEAALAEIGTVVVDGRRDELDAVEVAKIWARQHPLEDVYVAKVEQIISSRIPEIVQKNVSGKGVLPT